MDMSFKSKDALAVLPSLAKLCVGKPAEMLVRATEANKVEFGVRTYEYAISAEIDAEVGEPGSVGCDPVQLLRWLREAGETTEFKHGDGIALIELRSGTFVSTLLSGEVVVYEATPDPEPIETFAVKAGDFRGAVEIASRFTTTKRSASFAQVWIASRDGTLDVFATDGEQLAISRLPFEGPRSIPTTPFPKTAAAMIGALRLPDDSKIDVTIGKRGTTFNTEQFTLYCRTNKEAGEPPPVYVAIDRVSKNPKYIFDRQALSDVLRLSVLTAPKKPAITAFKLVDTLLSVDTQSAEAEGSQRIEGDAESGPPSSPVESEFDASALAKFVDLLRPDEKARLWLAPFPAPLSIDGVSGVAHTRTTQFIIAPVRRV